MKIKTEDLSWRRMPNIIITDKRLTPTARTIYTVLLDLCTKANNIIRKSTSEFARIVGCCKRSVVNSLKCLAQAGYIQKAEKAYKTEINSLIIKVILPPKKNDKSVPAEQSINMQSEQPKVRQSNKKEKKKYGEYGRVKLTDEEFNSLVNDFGQKVVDKYIQIADDYSKEHNRWYGNNAETIRKWIEEDRNQPNHRHNYGKNKKRKNNTLTEEKLAGYMQLVNRFSEDEDDAAPPSEPIQKSDSESEELELTSEYEMTDKEITQILDHWNYDIIYKDRLHPLWQRVPGELIDLAKKQRKQRSNS